MARPLVCFDLGRVLVRICDNWHHAGKVAGISGTLGELSPQTTARLVELVCLNETGKMDQPEFASAAAPLLQLEADQVVRMFNAFTIGPFDGTAQLLEDLAGAKVTTACLSNTNDPHWQIMTDPARFGGLRLDHLSYRFASHLLGLRKPDAAIYKRVERETNTAARDIVFFDDVEENIAAAAHLGWNAHRILIDGNPTAQIRRVLSEQGILSV